jgi:hypothetical protein
VQDIAAFPRSPCATAAARAPVVRAEVARVEAAIGATHTQGVGIEVATTAYLN